MTTINKTIVVLLAMGSLLLSTMGRAALINNLSDDFNAPTLDATKWNITNRGLEKNGPAYSPQSITTGGSLTFAGTMPNNNFWDGMSVESVNTFSSSFQTVVQVDRISLSGTGTGYRSSLWLLGDNTHYLHFSDNSEGGPIHWQYNYSDNGAGTPTGTGINIAAFDGGANDNFGLHTMKLVYTRGAGNNASIAMYLDGVLGTTQNFTSWTSPSFEVILTGQGRQFNDTVTARFDNLQARNFVPEPSSLLLLGVGIGLLRLVMRRRHVGRMAVGLVTAGALAASSVVHGGVISFDFGGGMAAGDLAGAPGQRVANWNNVTGSLGAGTIKDSTGSTVPSMTMTWTAGTGGGFQTGTSGANDTKMFSTWFDQFNGTASTIALANIPYTMYDVYFYMHADHDGPNRTGEFTIGSQNYFVRSLQSPVGDPNSSGVGYVLSTDTTQSSAVGTTQGNYVLFSHLQGSSLNAAIAAGLSGDGAPRNKFAGFEIVQVQVPEPSTLLLLGIGFGLLRLALRRRRAGRVAVGLMAAGALAMGSVVHGGIISFDFGGGMAAGDLAGAPGERVANWNNVTGNLGAGTVKDSTGVTVPSMTMTWTGAGFGFQSGASGANDARMFSTWYDVGYNGTPTTSTLQVTNIPYNRYNVLFYMHNDSSGTDRTGGFTIGGSSYYMRSNTAGDPTSAGTGYVLSTATSQATAIGTPLGNYVDFLSLSGSTLNASVFAGLAGDNVPRNKFVGFQIMDAAVPEPSTLLLLSLGVGAWAYVARRRRAY